MTEKKRVLLVVQEVKPFTEYSEMSDIVFDTVKCLQDKGADVRVLMPRIGLVNERRHRLHEVVRLSGMNIVVDDDDYPLIIKVASLTGTKSQVYFLDNEEKTNLLHGEAIAAGMIMESYISWQKGLLTTSEHQEIKQTIKNIFETISFNENDIQPILDLLIHDKKNEYGKIQFALLDGIGQININQEADNELIIKSFADYKN